MGMGSDLISVADAAKILGRDRRSLFKVLKRLNIEKRLIKSEQARGQAAAYISSAEFETLQNHLDSTMSATGGFGDDSDAGGYFYVIQLEPELDPLRLKLGFATSVEDRVRKHKTSAPFSKVLAFWPCKLLWEKTVIDCLTENSEKVYTEVFRVEDVEETIRRATAFFELMPKPFPEEEDPTKPVWSYRGG